MQELRERSIVANQTGKLREAMNKYGIQGFHPSTVLMHKIAVRENAIRSLHPLFRRLALMPWAERNMSRITARTQRVVQGVLTLLLFVGTLGAVAKVVFGEALAYGLGEYVVIVCMLIVSATIFWLMLEAVGAATALTWSESPIQDNPDVPQRGRELSILLGTTLGPGFHVIVHRLGPDPFLEGRFQGESAYFYGWDECAELREQNGQIYAHHRQE